jgi:hypothetical protein
MPTTSNDWIALAPIVLGVLSGIVTPIVLNAVQAWQERKRTAAEVGKTDAERDKTEADAASVVADSARNLIEPLNLQITMLRSEIERVKFEWAGERNLLQERIAKTNRDFTEYILQADERDRQSKERIKFLTTEIEQIRASSLKRESELLARIENLESENHSLRHRKRDTGGLGLATAK